MQASSWNPRSKNLPACQDNTRTHGGIRARTRIRIATESKQKSAIQIPVPQGNASHPMPESREKPHGNTKKHKAQIRRVTNEKNKNDTLYHRSPKRSSEAEKTAKKSKIKNPLHLAAAKTYSGIPLLP